MTLSPTDLLKTSFPKPTADCYWHFLMKNRVKEDFYQDPKALEARVTETISSKANPCTLTSVDKRGWTPMHVAALAGNEAGLRFLLSRNVSTECRSEDGCTPRDYCVQYHPNLVPLFERRGDVLEPALRSMCTPVPPGKAAYKLRTDFGAEIKQLLFAVPTKFCAVIEGEPNIDHLITNLMILSKKLDFDVTFMCNRHMPRDLWLTKADGSFVRSSYSPNISRALQHNEALAYHRKSKAKHLTTHLRFQNFSGATLDVVNQSDHQEIWGDLTSQLPSLKFYLEGGNYYLITVGGKTKLLLGGDVFYTALNQLRLDKGFDPVIVAKRVKEKLPLEDLTNKKTLVEMCSQDLLKESVYGELRQGKYKDYEGLSAEYLVQKELTQELIAESMGVREEDMIFLPQISIHLDLFLRPGPNGSVFVNDYQSSYDLLLEIQKKAPELKLTPKDLDLLDRYLATAKRLNDELQPLYQELYTKLAEAGILAIKTPGMFYDKSPSGIPDAARKSTVTDCNFMNAITGYSSKTKSYYYIVGGTSVGDRLGPVLMGAYRRFIEMHVPAVDVHFIGYDPQNPTDFSEIMAFQNRHTGLHCLSFEAQSVPHEEEGKRE